MDLDWLIARMLLRHGSFFSGPASRLGFVLFIADLFLVLVIAWVVSLKKKRLTQETRTGTIFSRKLFSRAAIAEDTNPGQDRQAIMPGTVEAEPRGMNDAR